MSSRAAMPPDGPDALPGSRSSAESGVGLSIIAPAHDEQDNISGLVRDVEEVMSGQQLRFELILIDDGSTDRTASVMARETAGRSWLRCYAMANTPSGSGNGQSAAFHAGIRLARGSTIALLDADRQNDPADLPGMLDQMEQTSADMIQGDRSASRRDSSVRRVTSWVGRTFRLAMLGDTIRDTGCSLRVFTRELGLLLPLQYQGMHRFIPFYARSLGYRVIEVPVRHRPRTAGKAKYGVWNRALPGLRDLIAVRWMRKRLRDTATRPIESSKVSP